MSQSTITINGTVYDTQSGLPIKQAPANSTDQAVKPTRQHQTHHSQAVHRRAQKSTTLNRKTVSTPHPVQKAKPKAQDVQRSPSITKFAPAMSTPKQPVRKINDFAPAKHHPIASKAFTPKPSTAEVSKPATNKPSEIIKQESVSQALDKATAHNQKHRPKKSPVKTRFLSLATASMALLLLGGYFTYINMPNLSVRVAAAQAGIEASYPQYQPDGYSLRGPVAYDDSQVNMKFAANGGTQSFTIGQTESSWDSSAVLENHVKEKVGDNYLINTERGLTIYTFSSQAAWVNGGILYTIEGDAPLSTDQILRIAEGM